MALALYDPTEGYYARPSTQLGREGDFYTSVSVGSLFGKLLARRFIQWWESNEQPPAWRILEMGAHNGLLAEDILREILKISPVAWSTLEYAIPEPLPHLRSLQIERLAPLAQHFFSAGDITEIANKPLIGIAFGNEILDALPFHLVKMSSGIWKEMYVTQSEIHGYEWILKEIDPMSSLSQKLQLLGTHYPEEYQTEVRVNFPEFLASIKSCISNGLMIFADYGFAAPEYYDTSRNKGTLRTYCSHQAGEDPLSHPGNKDITAHVDFTDLAKVALNIGYIPNEFSNQGSYLTHLAKSMIYAGEMADHKIVNQFQTLTHPAHLGARFHFIELSVGNEITERIAHRLSLPLV